MKDLTLIKKAKVVLLIACAALAFTGTNAFAQEQSGKSLLEYYNTADKEILKSETKEMSEKLKKVFNKAEIEKTEKELEFSRYFSSFKNLITYGSKLAGYSGFEENIRFGRDQEIYKSLPTAGEEGKDKKSLIAKKYDRLEEIAEEEVLTYHDMMETAFDTCEIYSDSLFWGDRFFNEAGFKETMDEYFAGEAYEKYETEKKPLLLKSNPEYAKRIEKLVSLWDNSAYDPNAPIVDPKVISRL
jgi:hypothetical protein